MNSQEFILKLKQLDQMAKFSYKSNSKKSFKCIGGECANQCLKCIRMQHKG